MAILIGIKNEHTHGMFHGAEGFEGISMDASSIHIIKEGSQTVLEAFVQKARKEAYEAQKVLSEMENEYGEYTNLTSNQYDKLETQMIEQACILRFDKLLIMEGTVV
jgi:hypothetical protein